MKKIVNHKYSILLVIIILVVANYLSNAFYKKIDLTKEKRYSLSASSIALLKNLKEPVTIQVFLDGEYPASFKKFANATKEFLEACNSYAKGKLKIQYSNPFANLGEAEIANYKDSMLYLYDIPCIENIKTLQTDKSENNTKTAILPGAVVSSGNKSFGVNFVRRAVLDFTNESAMADLFEKIETSLEYKFMDAITKATNASVKTIGYATGNGEPTDSSAVVADIITTLSPKSEASIAYKFGVVNIQDVNTIPTEIQLLLITKPTIAFTEKDKLKIDQYIMHGGNVLWMMDNMYAEFDSLLQSGNQGFIAFDRALNMDDMLYKYGVRINQNLLQDLQSDKIPLVKGNTQVGISKQLVPFSYMPILQGTNHPISKNLDGIRSIFPNTLDTIQVADIAKTILLTSSANAAIIGTPYKVDFSFMQYADDKEKFTKPYVPVAVLLEGNFTSYFANRISKTLQDSLAAYRTPFIDKAIQPGKMIIVADGDIATNMVTQQGNPLQMGENNYTGITYANKDFFINCIDYLTGNAAVLQTRNKDYSTNLIDPIKKESDATKWKLITTAVPLGLLICFAALFNFIKKRKYVK